MAVFTAARITAFNPGASPPPVKIPIRFMVLLKKIQKTFTERSTAYLCFHLDELIKQSYLNLTIFLARNRIYSYNDRNGKHIYTTTCCESDSFPCPDRSRFGLCFLVRSYTSWATRQGGRGWLRDLSSYWRTFLSYRRPSTPLVCALYG